MSLWDISLFLVLRTTGAFYLLACVRAAECVTITAGNHTRDLLYFFEREEQ
jgi:hypothetical protein